MGLCAFRKFGVSPTNTSLYSLLLIFNTGVSHLVLGKKRHPRAKRLSRVSLLQPVGLTSQTCFSLSIKVPVLALVLSCSGFPALSLSLLMDPRQQDSRNQGYICSDSSSSVSCTLSSQSHLTLAYVLESLL